MRRIIYFAVPFSFAPAAGTTKVVNDAFLRTFFLQHMRRINFSCCSSRFGKKTFFFSGLFTQFGTDSKFQLHLMAQFFTVCHGPP